MEILTNFSLKKFNSFKIDAIAENFVSVKNVDELVKILKSKKYPNKYILGGGSNILITKKIKGLLIHINLKGIYIESKKNNITEIVAFAGENWHSLVKWCLNKDLGGVENLSLIPGSVGAAPVQNIGAYGIELKDLLISCEAINRETGKIKTFDNKACQFEYRNSIFKRNTNYVIISVKLKLTNKEHNLNLTYKGIQDKLDESNIKNPTIKDVSNAVIKIRNQKLPNPDKIGNSGSFFKNPIVSKDKIEELKSIFHTIPFHSIDNENYKIPAAWLIEKAGFKGKNFGNYGVHKDQALVLVNYKSAKGSDLLNLSISIQKAIKLIFGIELETEVNII
ncbi:MAG TPA: UDP-N-acetylmuramate dehydrogenase [Flavobacteriaceae bacterium]|nr:UDP-N-acetylmuramate dehydrogenase [Flavobacteriaceae bacterium]